MNRPGIVAVLLLWVVLGSAAALWFLLGLKAAIAILGFICLSVIVYACAED